MTILTAEQIATIADFKSSYLAERRAINARYRKQDTSDLYPIQGQFNATNKAIRRVVKWEREAGVALRGLEYCYAVENELDRIVNQEV